MSESTGPGPQHADAFELLRTLEVFEYQTSGASVTIRRTSPYSWNVYHRDDLIGSFALETRDHASYFVSEVASEPGIANWVSDDIRTPIEQMLLLAD
ncbi:hypothetical protein [Microbacterium gilvum]|uniref:Uncharacterized protein n=1 Tax=Microbacterium gilvum TaxID=1336204 RepID=A0ABP8ZPV9_9MICO